MKKRILLGVSSCLLGEKVRFDGGHKRDNYICDLLSHYVDFLPICPEVAIGMGIPRPAIRLIGDSGSPRLVEVKNHQRDYTQPMLDFANETMKTLTPISGYILKSKSPTCGLKRVKIYRGKEQAPLLGEGLYASVLKKAFPCLPIEEEGRLNDAKIRENFIERLFIYHDWQVTMEHGFTGKELVNFHTRHKLALMAHHPHKSRELGRLVGTLDKENSSTLMLEYLQGLMAILSFIATPAKHANVLQHCLGYFKKVLSAQDKQELLNTISNYQRGLLPLIVPITLLKHHLSHHPQPYLEMQSYLSPYPEELMLRNHI
ncbi:TPA: YbgA family protein [Legionella feeleii]